MQILLVFGFIIIPIISLALMLLSVLRKPTGHTAVVLSIPDVAKEVFHIRKRIALLSLLWLSYGIFRVLIKPEWFHLGWIPARCVVFSLLSVPFSLYFIRKYFFPDDGPSETDDGLESRTGEISKKLGVKAVSVRILCSKEMTGNAYACYSHRKRTVFLSKRLVEAYEPQELDWMLAHEVAHAVPEVRKVLPLDRCAVKILAFGPLVAFITFNMQGNFVETILVLLPVAAFFVLLPASIEPRLTKLREYFADYLALKVSGDADAAGSAMRKMIDLSPDGVEDGEHPTPEQRISAMRYAHERK